MELARLRQIYGLSAAWWVIGSAFRGVRNSAHPLRWLPKGPNSVLVYGAATSVMATVMATLVDSGIRAELLVADPALGGVQVLIDAGWVCIGTHPFMRRWASPGPGHGGPAEPTVSLPIVGRVAELTGPAELKIAGQIVADAHGRDPDPIITSTPNSSEDEPVRRVWGVYDSGEMVSCATTVEVGDTVVLWDVATRPNCQRRGYGKTLLNVIHARYADSSQTRQFLLSSSDAGYHLYESLGYETVAWWQAWSRPRWALAAS
jgi:ribosomal protein S18 acetylase RimI-like enzyme